MFVIKLIPNNCLGCCHEHDRSKLHKRRENGINRQAMDHSISKQCDSQNSLNSFQLPDRLLEYQTKKIFIPVNLIGGTQIGAFPLLLSTAIVGIV